MGDEFASLIVVLGIFVHGQVEDAVTVGNKIVAAAQRLDLELPTEVGANA